MKRCPECQFLYEDAQKCCDMDGTVLRFTSFLPPLARQAIEKNERQSMWGRLTIPLLTLVVIGSVLMTLYRATPTTLISSSAPSSHQASASNDTTRAVAASPQAVTASANSAKSRDPFRLPATAVQDGAGKSGRPAHVGDEKRFNLEPATHVPIEPPSIVVNPAKPSPTQTSSVAPASAKATTSPITVHNETTPNKPAPQSKPQNQDKDSKFKSLFKKAGRVLKKPF
jgi:hypothetical protein